MSAGFAATLAAIPIVAILILMLGLRWSAAKAGSVGLALTVLLAWFAFELGTEVLPALGRSGATLGSMAEALFVAATILWIIFPALCIHELQLRTGSVDVLRQAMGRLSHNPPTVRVSASAVAWRPSIWCCRGQHHLPAQYHRR